MNCFRKSLAIALVVVSTAFAEIKVGEKVPNLCWRDTQEKMVCIDDDRGAIRVLIYGAGWCGPCQREMEELVGKIKKYEGKQVRFYNLLAEGWGQGSAPDRTFLNAWKTRFNVPFTVAGSPNDPGLTFHRSPKYPNVAVVDENGFQHYKNIGNNVPALLAVLDKMIP